MDVDIDRTRAAALGAKALMDLPYGFIDDALRHLACNGEKGAFSAAGSVAETKVSLTFTAEKNGGTAVVAFGHC